MSFARPGGEPESDSGRPERAGTSAGNVVACLALVVIMLCVGCINWFWPSVWVCDDAYFYMRVGKNLAMGNGSTFSGVTTTNGYHPLWQWCVAGIALLWPENVTILRMSLSLSVLLAAVSFWLLWRLCVRLTPNPLAALAPLLFTFVLTRPAYGLETFLYVAMLLLFLDRTQAGGFLFERRRAVSHILMGLLGGAVILSRLDSVVVVAVWFAVTAIERWRKWGFARAFGVTVLTGLATTAVVAPYLIHNYVTFGHFATISSTLKTSFPEPTLIGLSSKKFLIMTIPGLVLGLVYLAAPRLWSGNSIGRTAAGGHALHVAIRIVVLGMCLHTVAIYTFSRWAPYLASYWVENVLVACLLVPGLFSLILHWCRDRSRGLRLAADATTMVLFMGPIVWATWNIQGAVRIGPANFAAVRALGDWYRQLLDSNDIVFQRDHVGEPAFWSERRVVDGGGLMNNFEYQKALHDGHLMEYLGSLGVTHIATDDLDELADVQGAPSDEYDRAAYTVNTPATVGIDPTETRLILSRDWEIGRYAYTQYRRPAMPVIVRQTFCIWELPPDWQKRARP
jgi:hypothetical protein